MRSRPVESGTATVELRSGMYVAWEIAGNPMRLALTGETNDVLVRVLGVGRARPQ